MFQQLNPAKNHTVVIHLLYPFYLHYKQLKYLKRLLYFHLQIHHNCLKVVLVFVLVHYFLPTKYLLKCNKTVLNNVIILTSSVVVKCTPNSGAWEWIRNNDVSSLVTDRNLSFGSIRNPSVKPPLYPLVSITRTSPNLDSLIFI